jgi:hypothetical protein
MSFSPGVVDTPMQETARSGSPPWFRLFKDLHSQGQPKPLEEPAKEVVEFLESDSKETFVERRFSTF